MKSAEELIKELREAQRMLDVTAKMKHVAASVTVTPEDLQDVVAKSLSDQIRKEIDHRFLVEMAQEFKYNNGPAVPAVPPIPKMGYDEMAEMISYVVNNGLISEEHICWMILKNKALFYKILNPTDKMREALSMAEL